MCQPRRTTPSGRPSSWPRPGRAGQGDRIAEAQQIRSSSSRTSCPTCATPATCRASGADGGYWLAEPADAITLADIIRAVDGPLASVRGARPESVEYSGSASRLAEVWIAVRVSLRSVLERVTLADLVAGPAGRVKELINDADAWVSRSAGGHTRRRRPAGRPW